MSSSPTDTRSIADIHRQQTGKPMPERHPATADQIREAAAEAHANTLTQSSASLLARAERLEGLATRRGGEVYAATARYLRGIAATQGVTQ